MAHVRRLLLALLLLGASAPAAAGQSAVLLDVPLHRQAHALSCEAAALQMALATIGIQVTEDDLLQQLARDGTPRTVQPDGSVIWGDPDVGFVGNWDGAFGVDGYGVYERPIADLAKAQGAAGSVAERRVDPADLYQAVREGAPVVVWMPYAGEVHGRGSWITPAGAEVDYVVTEHAVVLAGLDDNGVTFADPYTATLQRMRYDQFEAALAELGNRAVIVRP
ncbi:MAG: C39 family peptidase [Chloroflexi bacterium]|nr:C39 family peptidase [Chloroflexota bacterium]MBV9898728.1 C39 family peptidase [Chloroflexota bacterium]